MPDMNRLDAIDIIKKERDMVQKEIDVGQGTRSEHELVTAYDMAIKALEYVEKDMEAKRIRFRMPAKPKPQPVPQVAVKALDWTDIATMPDASSWTPTSADKIIKDIMKAKKLIESKAVPVYTTCPICGNKKCREVRVAPRMWYCFNCNEYMCGDNAPKYVIPR